MRGDIFDLMRAGDINRLTAVLDQNGLTVSSVLSEDGLTLLHYAVAMNGTPDVVKYMLENGAAVNPVCRSTCTCRAKREILSMVPFACATLLLS